MVRPLFLILGVGLLAYLIWRLGPREILALFSAIGWSFLPIALIYGIYQFTRALALSRCVLHGRSHSIWSFFSIRVAGEAVQYLTFTGPFLAEPAKAWLLKGRGLTTEGAFAATITEYLSYTFTSAAFTAAALSYLLVHFTLAPAIETIARTLVSIMIVFLATAAFAIARRIYLIGAVLSFLSRLPLVRNILRLDTARVRTMEDLLLAVFRDRPLRFLEILGLQFAAQFLLAFEAFLILRAMNLDFSALIPFVIEGAGKFISLAFFFVPTQVGAAEGTYIVIFQAVGLAAAAGLTLSLIRRLRSLFVAGLGLAALWLLRK